jgi:hypothetical protein
LTGADRFPTGFDTLSMLLRIGMTYGQFIIYGDLHEIYCEIVTAEFFADQTQIPGPGRFSITVADLPADRKRVFIILYGALQITA